MASPDRHFCENPLYLNYLFLRLKLQSAAKSQAGNKFRYCREDTHFGFSASLLFGRVEKDHREFPVCLVWTFEL
jgi:hypothetical protein